MPVAPDHGQLYAPADLFTLLQALPCSRMLRGSIDQKPGAAATFIAQVSLYSKPLGVAIAQTTNATD
jgi:hypothetical protein